MTTVQTVQSNLSGIGAGGSGLLHTMPSISKGAQTAETVEKEVVKKSLLASGLDALGGGLF